MSSTTENTCKWGVDGVMECYANKPWATSPHGGHGIHGAGTSAAHGMRVAPKKVARKNVLPAVRFPPTGSRNTLSHFVNNNEEDSDEEEEDDEDSDEEQEQNHHIVWNSPCTNGGVCGQHAGPSGQHTGPSDQHEKNAQIDNHWKNVAHFTQQVPTIDGTWRWEYENTTNFYVINYGIVMNSNMEQVGTVRAYNDGFMFTFVDDNINLDIATPENVVDGVANVLDFSAFEVSWTRVYGPNKK